MKIRTQRALRALSYVFGLLFWIVVLVGVYQWASGSKERCERQYGKGKCVPAFCVYTTERYRSACK